jgi:hypothetical protein
MKRSVLLVTFTAVLLGSAPAWSQPAAAPGQAVEVLWNSKWYAGRVLETDGARTKIHYEGWPSHWDEWVTPDRLRPAGALSAAAAAPSSGTAPVRKAEAAGPAVQTGLPADPPMGKWSVYQTGAMGYGYQHWLRLSPGRYETPNGGGAYAYDKASKGLRFTSGPLKGFGGLYYTNGRNAKNEPTIAMNALGAVDLSRNDGGGALQFAKPSTD